MFVSDVLFLPDHYRVSVTIKVSVGQHVTPFKALGDADRYAGCAVELKIFLWPPSGEFFDLETLSEVCKQTGRYTFFFTSWPLNM